MAYDFTSKDVKDAKIHTTLIKSQGYTAMTVTSDQSLPKPNKFAKWILTNIPKKKLIRPLMGIVMCVLAISTARGAPQLAFGIWGMMFFFYFMLNDVMPWIIQVRNQNDWW